MKIKILLISLILLLSSCSEDYSPKPLGHFRIDFAEKEYETFSSNCSYQFSLPTNTRIITGKKECWYNIYYPNHDATIYLTYKMLDSNLASITVSYTHLRAHET